MAQGRNKSNMKAFQITSIDRDDDISIIVESTDDIVSSVYDRYDILDRLNLLGLSIYLARKVVLALISEDENPLRVSNIFIISVPMIDQWHIEAIRKNNRRFTDYLEKSYDRVALYDKDAPPRARTRSKNPKLDALRREHLRMARIIKESFVMCERMRKNRPILPH